MTLDREKIRDELLVLRREVVEHVGELESDIHREKDSLDNDFAEQAVQRENDEVLDRLDEAGREKLLQIDATLARLEKGEYGVCESCGSPINPARLEALPYTSLCVKCASVRSRGKPLGAG